MSLDFINGQDIQAILKNQKTIIDNTQEILATIDDNHEAENVFKHLDLLSEKVRYTIANHKRFAKTASKVKDLSPMWHHDRIVSHLSDVILHINEIKDSAS